MEERLQKIIAQAGITSRRHAEELIVSGQVTVNGQVVTQLGSKADPERDSIKVAGRLLRGRQKPVYLLVHKPFGYVSTMNDPEGRPAINEIVRSSGTRIYPVGQLDYDEQGLLLLTNDGELTNRMMKLAVRLPQTYWLKVKGRLGEQNLRRLLEETGVRFRLVKSGENPWYEVVVRGANADTFFGENWDGLRATLVRLGHPVEKIRRVKLATLELGRTPYGEYRRLTPDEVERLKEFVGRMSRGATRPQQ
jgi:pseudouridine synthase